jgi:hypothetical protein
MALPQQQVFNYLRDPFKNDSNDTVIVNKWRESVALQFMTHYVVPENMDLFYAIYRDGSPEDVVTTFKVKNWTTNDNGIYRTVGKQYRDLAPNNERTVKTVAALLRIILFNHYIVANDKDLDSRYIHFQSVFGFFDSLESGSKRLKSI